jgi:hypothetical protein
VQTGATRHGRALRALAGIAAVAVACAGCSGIIRDATQTRAPSHKPTAPARTHSATAAPLVSVSSALENPCLLVSEAQAQVILESGVQAPTPTPEANPLVNCNYQADDGLQVTLALEKGSTDVTGVAASVLTDKAAPVPSVGHEAVCGPTQANADVFTIISDVADVGLAVIIGPSCPILAQFAQQMYASLGS